jgi:RNA polymerase sigma-70 factor, ECF subfamily
VYTEIRSPMSVTSKSIQSDSIFARARDLDEQALAVIHDQHYPSVYRYVRYRLDDELLVEDISAEVFLRLLDALHRKNGEIRDVRAWLLGTAANLINDHLRRKYRRKEDNLDDFEFLVDSDSPEHSAVSSDQNRQVRDAMRKLTSDQQQVLSLRFALEYSVEETARVMRKTAGAVKVLQFRALASLRRMLEGKDHL